MDSVSTTGVGNNTEWAYYGLIEGLISSYCDNHRINYTQLATRISSWCWGRGETSVNSFVKGTELYNTLISYIEEAYEAALSKGYAVAKVPAVTYVQGEADLLNPSAYKAAILQMQADLNTDIKAITGQTEDVALVLYQTNQLSLYGGITPNDFEQTKAQVPTAQYELIRDNEDFVASTPIYWMTFYNEHIHIDGYSQKMAGCMYGRAIFNLIEGRNTKGLIPTSIDISENDVILTYNVPSLPLVIDTHTVSKVDDNYGYNVVKSDNTSILQSVEGKREKVILHCSEPPLGCKVRYGINGTTDKSGWENGARGNIRDSSIIPADIDGKEIILHNWAYMFDEVIEDG